jgi:hypothetical protein
VCYVGGGGVGRGGRFGEINEVLSMIFFDLLVHFLQDPVSKINVHNRYRGFLNAYF